ncbi:glycosyltransferase [Novispirillum sp. DQ9]|uniref:glycosyltransferase n=1 Tax=Novispirillum sp. DQ9 TaxID=3398612 RepID=UPI003C7EA834
MTIKVLHLISGLGTGGAERMLTRVATRLEAPDITQGVISMTGPGTFGPAIAAAGVPLHDLGMARGRLDPRALGRLAGLLRHERPDVLMTWLYHADLLGTVATLLPGTARALAWNLRCSDMDGARYGRLTRLLALLSGRPAVVVSNSEAGRRFHAGLGYRPKAWRVLPNGIDMDVFRPDPAARPLLRAAAGLPAGAVVVGVVARVDAMKGHGVFLDAFAALRARRPEVHAVLIGKDTGGLPAAPGVVALGERSDVPALVPGLDLLVSPSLFGEGFSNVIGEAMACGVPVAATDVGDAALIVGDTGRVVPPGDAAALAGVMDALLGTDLAALGAAARRRVEERWALPLVLETYAALFRELSAR